MTWTKSDNEFMSEIKSQFRRDGSIGTEGCDGSGPYQICIWGLNVYCFNWFERNQLERGRKHDLISVDIWNEIEIREAGRVGAECEMSLEVVTSTRQILGWIVGGADQNSNFGCVPNLIILPLSPFSVLSGNQYHIQSDSKHHQIYNSVSLFFFLFSLNSVAEQILIPLRF